MIQVDGTSYALPPTFVGGEARPEDYMFLQLMEREWNRCDDPHPGAFELPSHRALLALLYWTYFETRIERLVRLGLAAIPENLAADILDRNSSITARLTRLYKLLFGTTYQRDLTDVGATSIWALLEEVRKRRNAFVHGDPKQLDDAFIVRIVEHMQAEHDAWIAVFNKRVRLLRGVS